MTAVPLERLVTTEELLALPGDGADRDLVRGRLRARPPALPGRAHGVTAARLSYFLARWHRRQPESRGLLMCGPRVRLRRDPDTTVRVDVAYFSAGTSGARPDAVVVAGPPALAIEILSRPVTWGDIADKVTSHLEAGTQLV